MINYIGRQAFPDCDQSFKYIEMLLPKGNVIYFFHITEETGCQLDMLIYNRSFHLISAITVRIGALRSLRKIVSKEERSNNSKHEK